MLNKPTCCDHCGQTLGFPFDPNAVDWIEAKAPTTMAGGQIPAFIIALPDERLLTQVVYQATGQVLAAWRLPQRQYFVELAMRVYWYLMAGGIYVGADLKRLDIDAECFDPFMDRDPSCKIMRDWPHRAKNGLIKKAPKKEMLDLIRLVNLALRTPPCGFAL